MGPGIIASAWNRVKGESLISATEFDALCSACDRALAEPDAPVERVAIPWLHVVRAHPIFLAQYQETVSPATSSRWKRCVTYARWAGWWIRHLVRAARAPAVGWFGPPAHAAADVLFVSHALRMPAEATDEDAYFGPLPGTLAVSGERVGVVLLNHAGVTSAAVAHRWNGAAIPRFVLSDHIGVVGEMRLLWRLVREGRRMWRQSRREPNGLYRRVLRRAAVESLSPGALTALRLHAQVSALVGHLAPRAIVITHEGHAWERLAFAGARRRQPRIKCIGYQHVCLWQRQHAIRRNLAVEYNPDVILTSGEAGCAELRTAPRLDALPIEVLGTNRRSAQASQPRSARGEGTSGSCLVLPEGIEEECELLFNFSIDCALTLPAVHFIWRLHPAMSFESLRRRYPKLRSLPTNVELSRGSLAQDVERSRWALYRGTTAIVSAIEEGVRPIYLSFAGEMSIDPLYGLASWREVISNVQDFQRVVAEFPDQLQADLETARRYCDTIFQPFDVSVLQRAIAQTTA